MCTLYILIILLGLILFNIINWVFSIKFYHLYKIIDKLIIDLDESINFNLNIINSHRS
jgi:hypothetical protein